MVSVCTLYSMAYMMHSWTYTVYSCFQIAICPGSSLQSLSFLAFPMSVAACRPRESHSFTYGVGSKVFSGGPSMVTNISDDMWTVVSCVLIGEQIIFMRLNARSHAAVLMGKVSTAYTNLFITAPLALPFDSLYSLYCCLSSPEKGTPNFVHNSRSWGSPYSGVNEAAHVHGKTCLYGLHKGLFWFRQQPRPHGVSQGLVKLCSVYFNWAH